MDGKSANGLNLLISRITRRKGLKSFTAGEGEEDEPVGGPVQPLLASSGIFEGGRGMDNKKNH